MSWLITCPLYATYAYNLLPNVRSYDRQNRILQLSNYKTHIQLRHLDLHSVQGHLRELFFSLHNQSYEAKLPSNLVTAEIGLLVVPLQLR